MFEGLEERIRRHGLERVGKSILESVKECVRLKAEKVSEDSIPIGASKLGGRPDLPADVAWPDWQEGYLSFLAQVNTDELPDFAEKALLPPATLLSLFWDTDAVDSQGPDDGGAFRVIASPLTGLERRAFPPQLLPDARFTSCRITARKALSLPDWESPMVEAWG